MTESQRAMENFEFNQQPDIQDIFDDNPGTIIHIRPSPAFGLDQSWEDMPPESLEELMFRFAARGLDEDAIADLLDTTVGKLQQRFIIDSRIRRAYRTGKALWVAAKERIMNSSEDPEFVLKLMKAKYPERYNRKIVEVEPPIVREEQHIEHSVIEEAAAELLALGYTMDDEC